MLRQRSVLAGLSFFSALATGVVFSYVTSSHAGFEWVPASQSSSAPVEEIKKETLEMGGSSIEIEPALPLPETAIEIDQESEGVLQPLSLPEDKVTTIPLPRPSVDKNASVMKSLQIQKTQEQEPVDTPQNKQLQIQRPEQQENSSVASDPVQWNQKERLQNPVYEPLPPLEAPQVTGSPEVKTKIMLPEDAPLNARAQIDNKAPPAPAAVLKLPVQKPAASPDAASAEKISYEVTLGFGSDTPLAFALRQVVPADYSFSLGRHVNPGALVSWNGGKPWNEVVSSMIAPLGLNLSVQKKNVFIYSEDQGSLQPVVGGSDSQDMTVAANNNEAKEEPVSLVDESFSLSSKRLNITNPGERVSSQPEETMIKIDRLADADQILQRIEPSAGNPDSAPKAAVSSSYEAERFWEGKAGQSAKAVIESWAGQADVELLWKASHDFTIARDFLLNGRFDTALKTLVAESLQGKDIPAIVLTKTPEGPKSARLIIR